MIRHISDLSCKMEALKGPPERRSESISSAPDEDNVVFPCSPSTSSIRTTSVACRKYSVCSTLDYHDNSNSADVPSSDGSESNVMP